MILLIALGFLSSHLVLSPPAAPDPELFPTLTDGPTTMIAPDGVTLTCTRDGFYCWRNGGDLT